MLRAPGSDMLGLRDARVAGRQGSKLSTDLSLMTGDSGADCCSHSLVHPVAPQFAFLAQVAFSDSELVVSRCFGSTPGGSSATMATSRNSEATVVEALVEPFDGADVESMKAF